MSSQIENVYIFYLVTQYKIGSRFYCELAYIVGVKIKKLKLLLIDWAKKFSLLLPSRTPPMSEQSDPFARTPPDRPMWIAPHHRISKDSAFWILYWIIKICDKLGFEIDGSVNTASKPTLLGTIGPKQTLFSMPYIARSEGGFCHFWISVFKDNNTDGVDRHVIEFQRSKSDDGFAFGDANRRFWGEFGKCVSLEQQQQTTTVQRRWGQRANVMRADAVPAHEPTPEEPSTFFWSSAKPIVPFQQIPLPAQSADASFRGVLSTDPAIVLQQTVACMLRQAGQYFDVSAIASIADFARGPNAQLLIPRIPDIVALLKERDEDLWKTCFFAADATATLLTAQHAEARELVLARGGHELLLALVERSSMPAVLREAGRALVALGAVDANPSDLRGEAIHKLTTFKAAEVEHALRAIGVHGGDLETTAEHFLAHFDAAALQMDEDGALRMDAYLKVTTYKRCEDVRELGRQLARL